MTTIEQSSMDYFGYVPVLSTLTGGVRLLFGIVKIIANLAVAIIGWDRHFLNHALDGFHHSCRGCIEMVPIIGNITVLLYDIEIGCGKLKWPPDGQLIQYKSWEIFDSFVTVF